MKNEDLTVIEALKQMPDRVGAREVTDENYYRTGWVLDEEMTAKMLETATVAKKSIHVDLVAQKKCLEYAALDEQVDLIRGIVMMAYPAYHGLGEWEPVRCLLEETEVTESPNTDDMKPETASMWFAGKELEDG